MPYVELQDAEGQRWRLRYPMKALRWFEAQTGESFSAVVDALAQERWTLEQIGWLVAAALYHERPEVTIDDADEVIDAAGFQPVIRAVAGAIERSSFAKGRVDESATGGDSKNAGTGTSSNSTLRTLA